jgi:hypothetical protein
MCSSPSCSHTTRADRYRLGEGVLRHPGTDTVDDRLSRRPGVGPLPFLLAVPAAHAASVGRGLTGWSHHGRVRNWLIGLGIGVACMVASWAVLALLARRLPPGHHAGSRRIHSGLRYRHPQATKRSAGAAQGEDRDCLRGIVGRQSNRLDTRIPAGDSSAGRHRCRRARPAVRRSAGSPSSAADRLAWGPASAGAVARPEPR